MRKSIVFSFIVILLIVSFYVYESGKNHTTPDDVHIEAALQPIDNDRMDYKDVMLEVLIDKKKFSQNMIYPYSPKLWNMTFDSKEDKGYFTPSNIGNSGSDMQKVISSLQEHHIIDNSFDEEQLQLIGFWSPQQAGSHKMRMYFETKELKSTDEIYLIYVHEETGLFGQDLSWTKLVKVKNEIYEG